MRIAITSSGPDLDASFDPRFGRAAYFIVFDEETDTWQSHTNPAMDAPGGAGVQAAQFIANQGVTAVISGDFGPNAYRALSAAGLAMYLAPRGEVPSVRQLLHQYRAGNLEPVAGPTQRGHHGSVKGGR
ncbi:MAG: NifB/NifX family molybdenum-iron cluster-binding protein [Anaerolineae bacterium]